MTAAAILAVAGPTLLYAVAIWLAGVVMTGIALTVGRARSLFVELGSMFQLAGVHVALVLLTLVHALLLALYAGVGTARWLAQRLGGAGPAEPAVPLVDRLEPVAEGDMPTTVVLIHGTFATRARWIQAGSQLVQALQSAATGAPGRPHIARFIWSGSNDESARRLAGFELATQLAALRDRGHRILAVAHSHGGSVLLHALRATPRPDLVSGAAFIGTPFFQVEQVAALERISFLWWLLPNILIVVVGMLAAVPITSKWGSLPILLGVPVIMWRLALWRERLRRSDQQDVPWLLELGVVRHLDPGDVLIASTAGDEAQGLLRYAGLVSQALSHAIDRVIHGARDYHHDQPSGRGAGATREHHGSFLLNVGWLLYYAAGGLIAHLVLSDLPHGLSHVTRLALLAVMVLVLGFLSMRMVPLALRRSGVAGLDFMFVPYSIMLFVNGLVARLIFGLPAALITRNCLAMISEVPVGTWLLRQYPRATAADADGSGLAHSAMQDDLDIVESVSAFLGQRYRAPGPG